ncbi:MAG: TIM barrel protein [Desulfurococcaceae archaeon]|nr:TIM barrel protein [Desulfurococcaceae archaeon]
MLRKPQELHFGAAGIPNSTPRKSTPNGVKRVAELGLDAMEIEFVRGVRMSDESVAEVKAVAQQLGIALTVHAPYYINLNPAEQEKVETSINRILESARVGYKADAWSVVFHSGYYRDSTPEQALQKVEEAIKRIVKALKDEGIEIWIRPELVGGVKEAL